MKSLKELLIEFETNKENKHRWLTRNLLGYGEITIMYAKLGSLKTGVAIKMAMEVVTGGQELGHSLSGSVYYCSLDTPKMKCFSDKGIDGEQVSRPIRGNWFKPIY